MILWHMETAVCEARDAAFAWSCCSELITVEVVGGASIRVCVAESGKRLEITWDGCNKKDWGCFL